MKAAFHCPPSTWGKVFQRSGSRHPHRRAVYTLGQLVEELVKPGGRLRTATVRKKWAECRMDGCRAELPEVVVLRKRIRTVAMESEDHVALRGH